MARSDLILNIIRAGRKADSKLFQKAVEALIAEERAKQHHSFADQISSLLASNNSTTSFVSSSSLGDLFFEINPVKSMNDLVLDKGIEKSVSDFLEEQHRADLLRSYNIEPRNRILFSGPPGNGKTSIAEAIAESLMVPLIVVRYEGLIGSYLGETNQRLRKIFDYVRTRRCVLFFDEFDTVGKERGDTHDSGEIKRVVSSLLLQIDSLPSYTVIAVASNHPELLDRAVWRRFQIALKLKSPDLTQIKMFLVREFERYQWKIPPSLDSWAEQLVGMSFSRLNDLVLDIRRKEILQVAEKGSSSEEFVSWKIKEYKGFEELPRQNDRTV